MKLLLLFNLAFLLCSCGCDREQDIAEPITIPEAIKFSRVHSPFDQSYMETLERYGRNEDAFNFSGNGGLILKHFDGMRCADIEELDILDGNNSDSFTCKEVFHSIDYCYGVTGRINSDTLDTHIPFWGAYCEDIAMVVYNSESDIYALKSTQDLKHVGDVIDGEKMCDYYAPLYYEGESIKTVLRKFLTQSDEKESMNKIYIPKQGENADNNIVIQTK